MTLMASWHHVDGPGAASFGLPVVGLVSGKAPDWPSARALLLARASAGDCLNVEEEKEIQREDTADSIGGAAFTRMRFQVADLCLEVAAKGSGGSDVKPSVYGASLTDYWPGGVYPVAAVNGSALERERLRALALGPVVSRVECDAYARWSLADLADGAKADAIWKRYAGGLIVHRERVKTLWRDERGAPLPARWWVGNRNVQGEELPAWWNKATAVLMKSFAALGDSVVLFQGWVGDRAVRWTAGDAAFVQVMKA